MPKKETVFEYKVTGFWPFPLDMLRRDQAQGATVEDKALIALLSTDEMTPQMPDQQSYITLHGVDRPTRKRWESFNWVVAGSVNQIEIERPYTDEEKLALLDDLAILRAQADEHAKECNEARARCTTARTEAATFRAKLALAEQQAEIEDAAAQVSAEMSDEAALKISEILRSLAE